jgi:hypothetical protein
MLFDNEKHEKETNVTYILEGPYDMAYL